MTQQTKKAGEEQYVTAGLVNQGEHKGHLEGLLSNCDLQSFSGRFDTDRTALLTFLLLSKKTPKVEPFMICNVKCCHYLQILRN